MGSSATKNKVCKRMWKHIHIHSNNNTQMDKQTDFFAEFLEKEVAKERSKLTQKIFHSVISKIAFSVFLPSPSYSRSLSFSYSSFLSPSLVMSKNQKKNKCLRIFSRHHQASTIVCAAPRESKNSFKAKRFFDFFFSSFNFNLEANIYFLMCAMNDVNVFSD